MSRNAEDSSRKSGVLRRSLSMAQSWGRDLAINGLIASRVVPAPARWWLLRCSGYNVEMSYISPGLHVGGRRLFIGRGVFINVDVFLDTSAEIHIGERTAIGMRTLIVTSTHALGQTTRRAGKGEASPVRIGSGVWIGADVTVLPGVIIGDGAVIGAGSLVTRNCSPDTLYAGRPARVVREL